MSENEREGSQSLPGSLAEAFANHVDTKVTRKECECCGGDKWVVLTGPGDENNYIRLLGRNKNADGIYPGWPMLGLACTNCHHVRWFAIAPILREWQESRGE